LKNPIVSVLLIVVLTPLLLIATPAYPQQSIQQLSKPKPIVVLVEKVHGIYQYKINSIIVTHLLLELSKMESTYGENYPVVAIVDSRLPIDMLRGVDGIAAKAQLSVTRLFVYYVDSNSMVEIKFGNKALPFSSSPPEE
jgi:hypothetical protein